MEITPIALLLVAVALPTLAAPVAWRAKPAASRIGFTAYWQGSPVKGRFPQFHLTAKLDSTHPAGGEIRLQIAMTKLTTSSADITRAIRGAAWFDVKQYPEASFVSQTITKQGDGSFELSGKLGIKGHEKTITFPLEITREKGALKLVGHTKIDRSDFAIGSGRWSSGKLIARKVTIAFAIVLVRAH
ncbi:MAG: YceI family protein [Gammaproteobacteria bacterium]